MSKHKQPSTSPVLSMFQDSYRELTHTKTLIMLGLFMALCIVLASFRIRTPIFTISFTALARMYVALLVGPIAGGIFGITSDLLSFALNGGGAAFFPGYTLTEGLGMFLYGLFFYRQQISLKRVLLAKFVVILICNVFLGTLWLALMAGGEILPYFQMYLPVRLVKNLIQWPVDSVLFCMLAGVFARAGVTRMAMAKSR